MRERPHEKLEIYRRAHELALQTHAFSIGLPPLERFEEGSQLRRAAKSVSAQIVEGHGLRRYKAEYVHYLWRAYASAEETVEHLRLVMKTNSPSFQREATELTESYAQLASSIFNYILSVEQMHDTDSYVRENGEEYDDER